MASIVQKHKTPGIVGAIVSSEGIRCLGAAGLRKAGHPVPVTTNDLWHLGSETKAMTATLVGLLVERNSIRWDTTVLEVFPELKSAIHPDTTGVTVTHLLSHRAGLPANLAWRSFETKGTVSEQRQRVVKQALASRPKSAPGAKYEYSNVGYVIVGAMLEKITGLSWETLIRKEVFEPLQMTSAGFGGVGTPGELDQPWGHVARDRPTSETGPEVDNPPVLGPAGTVHATIQDWSRFIADQLRGARGQAGLLQPATYRTIQTPPADGEYALGWLSTERAWGGGTVLTHAGSNKMFFAVAWVAPQRDFAVLVCLNQGDAAARTAADDAVRALIDIHLSSALAD